MFTVHTDFECSNLRDRAFKCQTPTVEMRMTMQQDQIFKQNFFLIASSSLYNSAVLFGFACRVSSSKESEWCIALHHTNTIKDYSCDHLSIRSVLVTLLVLFSIVLF